MTTQAHWGLPACSSQAHRASLTAQVLAQHARRPDPGLALCVQDEEGRPGAGPRRAYSRRKGQTRPRQLLQGGGCCARGGSGRSGMPDGRSGESPGNNRAASLPAVRLQPSVTWEITRASGRSTSIGSKARTPQATSTASAITDSWHGSDEFPWKSTHLLAAQDVCKLCVYPSVSFKS